MGWNRFGTLLGLLVVGLQFLNPANAASVRAVGFDQLVADSGSIFEGRVVATEVVTGSSPKDIRTLVTFEVLDGIKGTQGDLLTLSFRGGATGDVQMQVHDMHIPVLGEHGIYFATDTQRRFINPLLGWEQGRFEIDHSSKTGPLVLSSRREPIYGVSSELEAGATAAKAGSLSSGLALGLRIRPESGVEAPMDPTRFKNLIRSMMP